MVRQRRRGVCCGVGQRTEPRGTSDDIFPERSASDALRRVARREVLPQQSSHHVPGGVPVRSGDVARVARARQRI